MFVKNYVTIHVYLTTCSNLTNAIQSLKHRQCALKRYFTSNDVTSSTFSCYNEIDTNWYKNNKGPENAESRNKHFGLNTILYPSYISCSQFVPHK